MKSIQKSNLSMGMGVRDYLSQYSAIITQLPNFADNLTTIQTVLPQIQAIAELQDFAEVGIADNKKQLRTSLCTLTADNSRKLVAFATITDNKILLHEIKNYESVLIRLADTDLRTKAQEVYDRAQSNLAELTAYGIDAATQTTLLAAINAFNISIPKPRLGIDERKQATQQLVVLFKTLYTALKNIDAVVEIVRLTQPNFYNGYKTVRKVIVTGKNTLAIKGLVTDAESGEPIKGVTVLFSQNQESLMTKLDSSKKAEPILTKKTADKGGFKIKSLPAGTYNVTVKKVGYTDQIVTVYVNDGEMSEVNVSIAKN